MEREVIEFIRGDSHSYQFELSVDDVPYELYVGDIMRFFVFRGKQPVITKRLTAADQDENGLITVVFSPEDTSALRAGHYEYERELVTGDGEVYTIPRMPFILREDLITPDKRNHRHLPPENPEARLTASFVLYNNENSSLNAQNLQDAVDQLDSAVRRIEIPEIVATVTGENVVLTDSSDKPLEGLVLYGKTTQDGTPSPANPLPLVSAGEGGTVNVKIYGKNLFDGTLSNGYRNELDGTLNSASAGIYKTIDFYIYAPGSYTFSFGEPVLFARVDGNMPNITSTNATYNLTAGRHYISFRNSSNTVWDDETEIQLEYGIAPTAYEPYNEPQILTVSTVDGLRGVPVSSGGNYTDENGQRWVCDEIDFGRGVYVQRCAEIASYNGESFDTPYISSTGELSAGAEVIYVLSVPVETSLTAAEIAAYEALHTNKPNTTIINDGSAGMSASYVADAKAYIDNKFAALEAAVLSLGGNV